MNMRQERRKTNKQKKTKRICLIATTKRNTREREKEKLGRRLQAGCWIDLLVLFRVFLCVCVFAAFLFCRGRALSRETIAVADVVQGVALAADALQAELARIALDDPQFGADLQLLRRDGQRTGRQADDGHVPVLCSSSIVFFGSKHLQPRKNAQKKRGQTRKETESQHVQFPLVCFRSTI